MATTLTNLIVNADFSDGVTGWTPSNANSGGNLAIEDGYLSYTKSQYSTHPIIFNPLKWYPPADCVLYLRITAHTTDPSTSGFIRFNVNYYGATSISLLPSDATDSRTLAIPTVSTFGWTLTHGSSTAGLNWKYFIKEAMCVDCTSMYNSGMFRDEIQSFMDTLPFFADTYVIPDPAPPVITGWTMPDGIVGDSYTGTITVDSYPQATYTVTGLPPGLSESSQSGTITISGTPTTAGNYTMSVTATNSEGTDTEQIPITILERPKITTPDLPPAFTGAAYDEAIQVSGSLPITATITGLPSGLTYNISGDKVVITGTTVILGGYTVSVSVQNAVGSDSRSYTLTVNETPMPPAFITEMLPSGIQGEPYDETIETVGTLPIAYIVKNLPPGIDYQITGNQVRLFGTPWYPGTYNISIVATNSLGIAAKSLSLFVAKKPEPPKPFGWLEIRTTVFRFVRVDRSTMEEKGDFGLFLYGGNVEYNDLISLKVSASLPFIRPPDIGFDYLRIYSTSTTYDGHTEEVLYGTFLISVPSSEIKWRKRTGEAKCYSLLQILADESPDAPLIIPEGTPAIDFAANIIRSVGLNVITDLSSATTSTTTYYNAGTPLLEIVNDLCTTAGFASADIDPSGTVRLYMYSDPASKAVAVTFRDDDKCQYDPVVRHDLDISAVPNVVKLTVKTDEYTMTAIARNEDPTSEFSIPRRGREITYPEEVNDIADQETLQALAERRLAEKSSAVESIEIKHVYEPYDTGDMVRLIYDQADFDFAGIAVKKKVTLKPGMPCETRLRRFVR